MRLNPIFLLILFCLSAPSLVTAQQKEPAVEEKKNAYYVNLSPSLISNLRDNLKFYMRCDIQLLTYQQQRVAEIKHHAPALRHALLMLLGDQKKDTVITAKGKEKLRKKALKTARGVMLEITGEEVIDDLFFPNYFVE